MGYRVGLVHKEDQVTPWRWELLLPPFRGRERYINNDIDVFTNTQRSTRTSHSTIASVATTFTTVTITTTSFPSCLTTVVMYGRERLLYRSVHPTVRGGITHPRSRESLGSIPISPRQPWIPRESSSLFFTIFPTILNFKFLHHPPTCIFRILISTDLEENSIFHLWPNYNSTAMEFRLSSIASKYNSFRMLRTIESI